MVIGAANLVSEDFGHTITKEDVFPSENIQIHYLDGAEKMNQTERGDWIDCYVYETVELKAGDFALINLGFSCKLPDGYEAHLVPRSSTFKHWGLIQTNSTGVIDQSYCGQDDIWKMPVYATKDTVINAGDRPCQFRIEPKMPKINFNEVDNLNSENRGGFGSSGK